jgi:hypothetical protein
VVDLEAAFALDLAQLALDLARFLVLAAGAQRARASSVLSGIDTRKLCTRSRW